MNIRNFFFILTFFSASVLHAAITDTTIISDGGPGPYCIGKSFIDSSSISIKMPEGKQTPYWIFLAENNSVLFSEQIDSGVAFTVSFGTAYYGLNKMYTLFPKISLQSRDTLNNGFIGVQMPSLLSERENLVVSGYKSIGVASGSFGNVTLEQGLDVVIGGELRPGTKIDAHLSDQGSTLDGATREISEFDMIYVSLIDPKFGAVVGDQYIEWPFQGILSGQKKIKGLSLTVKPGPFSVKAFGALSGGLFTIETWRGKNGIQGPYNLSGNGESGLITPVGGTVKVSVNGRLLAEGEDKDFYVDYDMGYVIFTPRILIKDEDLIKAEYEYKLFDYQRTLAGAVAGFASRDSIFSVNGIIWTEADNRNNPLDLAIDSSSLVSLSLAGDRPVFGLRNREVNRNDVPNYDQRHPEDPLYIKGDTAGVEYFRYKPYDPLFPEDRDGRYNIWFTYIGRFKGDYVRDISVVNRLVYKYVGKNRGDYLPQSSIPAPKRLTTGEITANLKTELFNAKVNVAGQDLDKNLFSSLDDSDNRSSAATVSILAGKKNYDRKSFWLSGNYRFASEKFNNELVDAFSRDNEWDDSALVTKEVQKQIWESSAGVTPLRGLSTEFGYGQNRSGEEMTIDRFSNFSRLQIGDYFTMSYNGALYRHNIDSTSSFNRKDNLKLLFNSQKHIAELACFDEWSGVSQKPGVGRIGGIVKYEFLPWNLKEKVVLTEYLKSNRGIFRAKDTGYTVTVEQSIDRTIFPWWKVAASTHYLYSLVNSELQGGDQKSSTLLIDALSTITSEKTGFTLRKQYRSSSEKASRMVQIPIPAATGQGTHIYDPVKKEYVPSAAGDWFIQLQEIYDSVDVKVKKTRFDLDWSFKPQKKIKGILNDLNYQGMLVLDEYLDSRKTEISSWLPGIYSLKNLKTSGSSSTYADLSYRQEIQWEPESINTVNGELFFQLAFRKIRTYKEPSLLTGFSISGKKKKFSIDNETQYSYFLHDDSLESDYYIKDFHTTLKEKIELFTNVELYLEECLGWARQYTQEEKNRPVSFDSSIYVQISPGIEWRPFNRGLAEASYTLSYVTLPGEIDYRIARGFSSGLSHLFLISASIQVGKHFSVFGNYRGEIFRPQGQVVKIPPEHTVSLEMRAFL